MMQESWLDQRHKVVLGGDKPCAGLVWQQVLDETPVDLIGNMLGGRGSVECLNC